MEKQLKIKSPTGCVHVANSMVMRRFDKEIYTTLCNHNDYDKSYGDGFWHEWPATDGPVTCKRCLKLLLLMNW